MTLILAAGCLAAAACGEEETGMKINWDLSNRHTLDQVAWQQENLDLASTQLEPIESVRIRLPGGKVLQVRDKVSDIGLYRRSQGPEPLPPPEGEVLDKVEVYSDPLSVEDAYKRALAYADQFDLPRGPLEGWRERRDRGVDPVTDRTATTDLEQHLGGGKDGPTPTVELLYSANDDLLWVVMVQLYWPEPRES